MERDRVYIPKTLSQITQSGVDVHNLISDSPLTNFVQVWEFIRNFLFIILKIFIMLLVGWPFYLATNAWSHTYSRRANHFEPSSPIFKSSQVHFMII